MAETVRIDKFLWAVRIYKTRSIAAEAVKRGKVSMGGAQVKSSRNVKVGDVITLRERSREQAGFKALREGTGVVTPKWLTFDAPNLTGTVAAMPAREDIDCPIEEHLIVELYSR